MSEPENPSTSESSSVDEQTGDAAGDSSAVETETRDASANQDESGGDPLQVELELARAEIDKYKDETLRAMAELDNIRKRAERDVEAAHKYGIERFVTELLPVKDSMDLGFDAANSADDVEALREGMSLTIKMFEGALEKMGVEALDPTGEKFDPEFHQAMMMEESVEAEPGTVLRVMQKGYSLNERLLRPAMVVVAKTSED